MLESGKLSDMLGCYFMCVPSASATLHLCDTDQAGVVTNSC